MKDSMVPLIVVVLVIIGSLARAIWGWLQSGEPFVKRKFAATLIFTIFTAALPIGTSIYSSTITVDNAGLVGICIAALLAGWGADSGLKELGKMRNMKRE